MEVEETIKGINGVVGREKKQREKNTQMSIQLRGDRMNWKQGQRMEKEQALGQTNLGLNLKSIYELSVSY